MTDTNDTVSPDLEAAVEYLAGEVEYAKGRNNDNVLVEVESLSLVLEALGSSLRDTHRASSEGGSGWLDIASCPKGHDEFLIGWPDGTVIVGDWNATRKHVDWAGSLRPTDDPPTHWMPLPPASGAEPNPQPTEVQALRAVLREIQHSIRQARIPGNDWKRELALIENLADAALSASEEGA